MNYSGRDILHTETRQMPIPFIATAKRRNVEPPVYPAVKKPEELEKIDFIDEIELPYRLRKIGANRPKVEFLLCDNGIASLLQFDAVRVQPPKRYRDPELYNRLDAYELTLFGKGFYPIAHGDMYVDHDTILRAAKNVKPNTEDPFVWSDILNEWIPTNKWKPHIHDSRFIPYQGYEPGELESIQRLRETLTCRNIQIPRDNLRKTLASQYADKKKGVKQNTTLSVLQRLGTIFMGKKSAQTYNWIDGDIFKTDNSMKSMAEVEEFMRSESMRSQFIFDDKKQEIRTRAKNFEPVAEVVAPLEVPVNYTGDWMDNIPISVTNTRGEKRAGLPAGIKPIEEHKTLDDAVEYMEWIKKSVPCEVLAARDSFRESVDDMTSK